MSTWRRGPEPSLTFLSEIQTWLKNYPPGVPSEIDPSEFSSINPRTFRQVARSLVYASARALPPRQRGRQKPEFGLHFGGVGDSVRDFLAKEFAIPLAKPVNRNFERSF